MSKKNSKRGKGPKSSVDRHVFSALLGLVLGAGAFYVKKSMDGKAAAATA
jgi:hypothetical protein